MPNTLREWLLLVLTVAMLVWIAKNFSAQASKTAPRQKVDSAQQTQLPNGKVTIQGRAQNENQYDAECMQYEEYQRLEQEFFDEMIEDSPDYREPHRL